jgi:non-ribosomal peptide synthetase component F
VQNNVIDYLKYGALLHSPDKVAVVDEEREFTFAELDDLSDRLATHIASLTAITRKPIAVFLPKCAITIIADLAIVKSANFYTNLDDKSPPERLDTNSDNESKVKGKDKSCWY